MSQPSPRRRPHVASAGLIDSAAIRADLAAIAKKHDGDEAALRSAIGVRLKRAMQKGRQLAEKRLLEGGSGRDCAEGLSS